MKTRRTISAEAEGGRHVRPLAVIGRIILAVAVFTLLIFALHETTPEQFKDPKESTCHEDESGARQIDWDSLPDEIVAWVEVPGTNIDEPVAQATATSPDQYLYRDALGQGAYGTPYIDCDCKPDYPFVVVYGHHMSDGSVFADFANYINREYSDEHRVVYVYTRSDNARHEYKVKAVDVVNAYRELISTKFSSEYEKDLYLSDVFSRCDLTLEGIDTSTETVWAFATCSYQTSSSRTVVYAAAEKTDAGDMVATVPTDVLRDAAHTL